MWQNKPYEMPTGSDSQEGYLLRAMREATGEPATEFAPAAKEPEGMPVGVQPAPGPGYDTNVFEPWNLRTIRGNRANTESYLRNKNTGGLHSVPMPADPVDYARQTRRRMIESGTLTSSEVARQLADEAQSELGAKELQVRSESSRAENEARVKAAQIAAEADQSRYTAESEAKNRELAIMESMLPPDARARVRSPGEKTYDDVTPAAQVDAELGPGTTKGLQDLSTGGITDIAAKLRALDAAGLPEGHPVRKRFLELLENSQAPAIESFAQGRNPYWTPYVVPGSYEKDKTLVEKYYPESVKKARIGLRAKPKPQPASNGIAPENAPPY